MHLMREVCKPMGGEQRAVASSTPTKKNREYMFFYFARYQNSQCDLCKTKTNWKWRPSQGTLINEAYLK
jgi:hypothetical protein